jgi:YHS domain-containing protein
MSLQRNAHDHHPVGTCCAPRSGHETERSCCGTAKRAQSGAIDPICQMEVERSAPGGGSVEVGGETFYFCSTFCRARFLEGRSPQKRGAAAVPR